MRTNEIITLLPEMAVFVEIVIQGSFSAAAKRLGLTPSAISRSVGRLEKALNIQLLYRTTRQLRLTVAGEAFFSHCQAMLNVANMALNVATEHMDEPQGTLHVSAPKAVAHRLIHPHIQTFLDTYPKMNIRLLYEDRQLDLIDEELDLVLQITNHPSPGLKGRRLMNIHHVLCASPNYLEKHDLPTHPKDLALHQCVYLGETAKDSCWQFHQKGHHVKVQVSGRYSANHSGARLDAALSGFGITSLPYFVAKEALQQGTLIQVLSDWIFITDYCGDLWALHTTTRYTPVKITAFIHFLSEKLAQTFS